MNVLSQDSKVHETSSQEYETQWDEPNLDIYKEGFLEATPKGRWENYQEDEDVLLCVA